MDSQRLLGIGIVLLVTGSIIYFGVNQFKKEVSSATASPSPSPSPLVFGQTANQAGQQAQQQERPLLDSKQLASFPGIVPDDQRQNKKVVLETSKGVIELEIYPEATKAASNFLILSANGFYDNLTFHRVEDWVIQGGDPKGDGMGGPGYQFEDEPVARPYNVGTVAMANSGPNTNGSQFFIMKKDMALSPSYTIFGQVISGQDVVNKIAIGDKILKATVAQMQ